MLWESVPAVLFQATHYENPPVQRRAHLNLEAPLPRRRFLKRVLLFAILHYVVVLGLAGVIFLASHLPPKAINLDPIIEGLVVAENILLAPRKTMLWLWPWETTPAGLGLALTLINSLVWGMVLAVGKAFWRKATT